MVKKNSEREDADQNTKLQKHNPTFHIGFGSLIKYKTSQQ